MIPVDSSTFAEVPPGWMPLVRKLIKDIEAILSKSPTGTLFKIVQIKSKFAELRFYYDLETDCEETREEISRLIQKAAIDSQTICEDCGCDGELVKNDGWLYVSCERCE